MVRGREKVNQRRTLAMGPGTRRGWVYGPLGVCSVRLGNIRWDAPNTSLPRDESDG